MPGQSKPNPFAMSVIPAQSSEVGRIFSVFPLFLLIFTMFTFGQEPALSGVATEGLPEVQEGKATFLQTALRTPFAITVGFVTIGCIAFAGFVEFWIYAFGGFEYDFPITVEIIQIGWKYVVVDWWWKPGVTWHLVVCIILYLVLMGGRVKNSQG